MKRYNSKTTIPPSTPSVTAVLVCQLFLLLTTFSFQGVHCVAPKSGVALGVHEQEQDHLDKWLVSSGGSGSTTTTSMHKKTKDNNNDSNFSYERGLNMKKKSLRLRRPPPPIPEPDLPLPGGGPTTDFCCIPPDAPTDCPTGNDIEFIYEGLAGVTCETMSFYLMNQNDYDSIEYFYSVSGIGNMVPGNTDIGLTNHPNGNPSIHGTGDDNRNYHFVAYAKVEGCGCAVRKCLLDCVPGGQLPSPTDPPVCDENVAGSDYLPSSVPSPPSCPETSPTSFPVTEPPTYTKPPVGHPCPHRRYRATPGCL